MSAAATHRDRAVVAIVAAATAVAFLPALAGGFVAWDDDTNFTGNPYFRGLGWQQILWAFTTFHLGVYQPLAWLALELQFVVGGLSPAVYHIGSWLLHALNAALVYRLITTLLAHTGNGAAAGPDRRGFTAAALPVEPIVTTFRKYGAQRQRPAPGNGGYIAGSVRITAKADRPRRTRPGDLG